MTYPQPEPIARLSSGTKTIAIIGAGFSGLILAINILRQNKSAIVLLIERAPEFGRGIAYATGDPRHLLNVRAANMSAFPDDPDHFIRWLSLHLPESKTQFFVPRHLFGTYLQTLLKATIATEEGAARLLIIPDEAVTLTKRANGFSLMMDVGRELHADHVVLAMGNLAPRHPPGFANELLSSNDYIGNPWDALAYRDIKADDRILLIGTGLTAVDAALGLDRLGHRGRIQAISRRGLAPRRHAETGPSPAVFDVPENPSLTDLVRLIRLEARSSPDGWRAAADGLRPHIQRIWRDASPSTRGRFLRHLRPWWDVHRHRIAPAVADALDGLAGEGRFQILTGKIQSATLGEGAIGVLWRPRHRNVFEILNVDRIINCTGASGDVRSTKSRLLASLIDQGLCRPDSLGLGVDVDMQCRITAANGKPDENLSAIGPMSRGAFWEVTAVPDIRMQANALASRLSS